MDWHLILIIPVPAGGAAGDQCGQGIGEVIPKVKVLPRVPVPTKNLVHVDFIDFRGIGPLALLA